MNKHKSDHGHEEMPDPEDIKKILNVISEKVPDLLKKLSDVLYSTDQAKKFGKAVAIFYKELKGTGMTDAQIFELTRQYMSTLNLGNVVGGIGKGHSHGHNGIGEEIGNHVRSEIEKELSKKKRK
jgi:hypothetical protein